MSAGAITLEVQGLLPLKQQMKLLRMPRTQRRRLIGQVARKVIRDSKQRVREQRDLQGRPYEERKRKRSRKMLSKLARELKTTRNDGLEATVGFFNPVVGRIAAKQQYGATERITAAKLKKYDKGGHNAPATRRQAKALREVGFKVKGANGKRLKSPSLKWITENMKIGQAGAALRYLREQDNETIKTSWKTVLPARSFLGATAAEVREYTGDIFTQMTQEIAHGAR